MKNLLNKELKLSVPALTYLFLAFTIMTFIPGYPILCGVFFVCFGIFQGYQYDREANDTLYSVLLPVSKKDVIKAKYLAVVVIEMMSFVLFAIFTAIRMTLLADVGPYPNNVLMAANPLFLAFILLIFTAFNAIFVGGFFKSAYKLAKPLVWFIVVNFLLIGIAETLHHLPGLSFLNETGGSMLWLQFVILVVAFVAYAGLTIVSCKCSEKRFEKIDL